MKYCTIVTTIMLSVNQAQRNGGKQGSASERVRTSEMKKSYCFGLLVKNILLKFKGRRCAKQRKYFPRQKAHLAQSISRGMPRNVCPLARHRLDFRNYGRPHTQGIGLKYVQISTISFQFPYEILNIYVNIIVNNKLGD